LYREYITAHAGVPFTNQGRHSSIKVALVSTMICIRSDESKTLTYANRIWLEYHFAEMYGAKRDPPLLLTEKSAEEKTEWHPCFHITLPFH
jgi:hypothetical protein